MNKIDEMVLTPAQRKAIYLFLAKHLDKASAYASYEKAIRYLQSVDLEQFVCINFIYNVPSRLNPTNNWRLNEYLFTEFQNFKPTLKKMLPSSKTGGGWWELSLTGLGERATALYLAAEMCE